MGLKNVGLSVKLLLLVAAFIAMFAAFALTSYLTLQEARVNGPLYRDIVLGKDVIADVLPPPQYIIETHLLTMELAGEPDPTRIASLIERGDKLRLEFDNRHEFWKRELVPGELADAMNVTAHRAAAEYFQIRDQSYIPAPRRSSRPPASSRRRPCRVSGHRRARSRAPSRRSRRPRPSCSPRWKASMPCRARRPSSRSKGATGFRAWTP